MPWCPRCDETFPQGPACPRCSARLVAREHEAPEDPLQAVPGLRSIKVSRRYLRALERISGPRQSSSRLLALALVLLVFASGYLLGRVGSLGSSQPTVRALPSADPLPFSDVKGSVAYLTASREPLTTIVIHDVYSGEVSPRARFSPPADPREHATTRVVSFGRSVAVVVEVGGRGYVAVAPHGRTPHGWVPGFDAAWLSEDELVLRQADGTLARWSADPDALRSDVLGEADAIFQTASGPVAARGDMLESVGAPKRRLALPDDAEVIAVSPDLTRAVLGSSEPVLWDGSQRRSIRAGSGRVLGASFERSSERVAVLMESPDGLVLAVVDARGDAALKPLGRGEGCEGTPAWDAAGRWVYVVTGGGALRAVEASGGRVEPVRTHGIGCGVAWVDTA